MQHNNTSPIPFIILTYGCRHIEKSINSLLQSTRIPLSLFIVNNSGPSSEQARLIDSLQKPYNLSIVHTPNLWVLSLNHPLIQSVLNNNKAYVVSDDDIIYPGLSYGDWLFDFLQIIDNNSHIGKLSLSLKWSSTQELPPSDIPFPMAPSQLINRECITTGIYEFTGDTTPALYRSRLFSPNTNFFSPRHQKLVKPSLRCGVSVDYSCFSMSNISNTSDYQLSYASHKAICFALTSAYLSLDNLRKTPLVPRIFYFLFRPVSNLLWLLHLFVSHIIFLISHLHRNRQ